MAKGSLAVCAMLLVALSVVYETQAQLGPGTVVDRLDKTFPKICKDFEPYAYKGLLDFVREVEVKCPTTPDFKDFFAILRDYIVSSFIPGSLGSIDMSRKARRLSSAMSTMRGTKETSVYYFTLIDSLISLQKAIVEIKKNSWNEISSDQGRRLWSYMLKWFSSISFFAKEAVEKKGKSIDISTLGISTNDVEADMYKANVNKSQGSFSLPDYLNDFPKIEKDFEPFAYKGMLEFLADLEHKCPKSNEFKDFFAKLWDYMGSFQTISPDTFSTKVDNVMTLKSKSLFRAISALNGTGGTLDPWRLVGSISSMGTTLVETRKSGATQITSERKRMLTWSLVNWARAVSVLVQTSAAKKGVTIDLSSFEEYYYSHNLVPSARTNPRIGVIVPKGISGAKRGGVNAPKIVTRRSHPNGGNVRKGTPVNATKPKYFFATKPSNATKPKYFFKKPTE